jgi:protein-disulfide isomerase
MPKTMKIAFLVCLTLLSLRAAAQTTAEKSAAASHAASKYAYSSSDSLESRVEHFLRYSYGWGDLFEVKVGAPKPSSFPELQEVSVTVAVQGQTDTATVYVDKNGKFLVRGEIADMTADPLAQIRSKLSPGDSPSLGPKNAKITLIEFADFQCPSCRQLDKILRAYLPQHPGIRLVYKNYPLTDLHPWAMTAAIAGQCAYQQNPDTFWKLHDAIFDAQDVINPSNVWDKMNDLAGQFGLNLGIFRSCMADPNIPKIINQTQEEGHSVTVTATPTTFVNGRRVIGLDDSLLQQFVQFESSN